MTPRYGIFTILMGMAIIMAVTDESLPQWVVFMCALGLLYFVIVIIHDELVRLTR